MKATVLFKMARQVEGEYLFVDVVKANTDSNTIRKYLAENKLPLTEVIQGIPCVIEYGVIEDVEIEEN